MAKRKGVKSLLYSQDHLMILFFSIMYLVGAAGHAWERTLPLMLQLTPWVLFLLGLLVMVPLLQERRGKVLAWALVVYLVTLFLEILGVHTGLVFGSYLYGETLGLALLGVPLVIGFNWVLVVLGAVLLANGWFANLYLASLAAGALCVFFDFILEPVAISPVFDYWQWAGGDIPLQNYAAWFVIATLAAAAFNYLRLRVQSPIPRAYFIIQLSFFILLRVLMRIW